MTKDRQEAFEDLNKQEPVDAESQGDIGEKASAGEEAQPKTISLDEHTGRVDSLKEKIAKLEADLAERDTQLAELAKGASDDQAKRIEELIAENEAAKADRAASEKRLMIENLLLKHDCEDTIGAMAHMRLDEVEFTDEGVKGLDIDSFKESNARLFKTVEKVSTGASAPGTRVDTAATGIGDGVDQWNNERTK